MTEDHLDRIHIRDLAVECVVGVNPEERVKKQRVVINMTLHADLSQACRSDILADTIDYKALKLAVLREVERSEFHLIERMAERIAEIALGFPVACVEVTVDKPGALRFARSVAVEITRRRKA
jgi:FolB domain-containing protein